MDGDFAGAVSSSVNLDVNIIPKIPFVTPSTVEGSIVNRPQRVPYEEGKKSNRFLNSARNDRGCFDFSIDQCCGNSGGEAVVDINYSNTGSTAIKHR